MNTVILEERENIVVLLTGLEASKNTKTGDMLQVYILVRNEHPIDAIRNGSDAAICGDCRLRGEGGKGRICYVQVHNAPSAMWRAYQRGAYGKASLEELARLVDGRTVRLGAYGDPAFMAPEVVRTIAIHARDWTGYTHQWRRSEFEWLRPYVMASCDSWGDYAHAKSLGWRTFRVAKQGDSRKIGREISCPASSEAGNRSKCADCGLCNGAHGADCRKDIVIQDHGKQKKNGLIQIG